METAGRCDPLQVRLVLSGESPKRGAAERLSQEGIGVGGTIQSQEVLHFSG